MTPEFRKARALSLAALVFVFALVLVSSVAADSLMINFESYTIGNINGQDGWIKTGSYDVAVANQSSFGLSYPTFGSRSLRISNAVTSGSFGDHAFSKPLVDEAGETTAANGGMSGGTRQTYYEASWDFASTVPGAEQVGLSAVASPDRGDGARMSWVQMADTPAGLIVRFNDYTSLTPGTCDGSFTQTDIATGLARDAVHSIRITMEFVDGTANDVVRVFVDGALAHTGTSWEDYFRDCESNPSRTVDSILFRVGGTAAPATSGYGFLIDNFRQFSGPTQCTTVCYVDDTGSDSNGGTSPADAFATIQRAIDQVDPGGEVRVLPGSYNETATNRDVLGAGNYQFGLFFEETAKDGVTLIGVTAADVAITDPSATEADITTNATNNFGYSGIFVEADDVTIAGLEIGPNTPGENKTIEIIGDGFTLKDSLMTGDGVDGAYPYFNDWRYDDGTDTAYLQSYTVTNNIFGPGSQIAISSGAGGSGPVSGRQITDNEFSMSAGQNWPSISFNGDGTTVPWFTYPVGGAEITGNTFNNVAVGGSHIRLRGVADDSEFDWPSIWNDNTYNKAVVAGVNPPNDVRAWSYTTSYTFNDVRVIGTDIQPEIDHAQPGDTVLVNEGTYPESPEIDKDLTLVSDDGRNLTFIELQTGVNYVHSLRFVDGSATVDGFTIVGRDAACPTLAATNLYVENAADNIIIKNNRVQVGQAGGCSTGDDGFGLISVYNETTDVPSVVVEDNIFEPLNATGTRAFYINPGVDVFEFRGNEITGDFKGSALTQAKDGLVEDNTLTGTGASRGFATWGYPDPTVYGATMFRGNTISDVVNAITNNGNENVTVTKNIFTGNDRAFYMVDDGAIDLSTIHVNRNSIDGNTMGVENEFTVDIDATCNWWGAANGPSGAGPGSGDPVSTFVAFEPWLESSDLDGNCFTGTVFISPLKVGSVDGIAYGMEDILVYDADAGEWEMFFDGSYYGLFPTKKWRQNINAIYIPDAGDPTGTVMSFWHNRRPVPGIPGHVYGQDLVQFNGVDFDVYFDGSDVGLGAMTAEKIDSLHILPGSESPIGAGCQAYLLISTQGPGKVPNHSGGQLKFKGEDVLGFCATNLGDSTTGLWHMVLQGKPQGMPGNSLTSISANADGSVLYFTTRAAFHVDSAHGGHSMVYVYDRTTQEFSGPIFSAPDTGFTGHVDALDLFGN